MKSPNLTFYVAIGCCLFLAATFFPVSEVLAQDYNTASNGNWTTTGSWTRISNWGPMTPATTGQGSGTINVNHDITMNANYTTGSPTLNIAANKTLTINGNFTVGGGATVNVYGTLYITGNATLGSNLRIMPGGKVVVLQTLTVNSDRYLTVGTNAAAPPSPYADLVVYGNLVSNSSGDVLVDRNGRVAIFGNVTGSGGGTLFTINNGGQVYIDGNINLTGNGSNIVNNNTTNPYGLYVGGTISNTGGGSNTTGNKGDENVMQTTNPPFFNWVSNLPNSTLPVTLLYFRSTVQADQSVLCSWATTMEKSADFFEIERSSNGRDFVTIGHVKAVGNSQVKQTYSFIDNNPLTGRNYYRLKEVDFDLTAQYFNITMITMESVENIDIYPNPTSSLNETKVKLNFEPNQKTFIRIMDNAGKEVYRSEISGFETIIPSDLPSGVYIVVVKNSQTDLRQRLVVH